MDKGSRRRKSSYSLEYGEATESHHRQVAVILHVEERVVAGTPDSARWWGLCSVMSNVSSIKQCENYHLLIDERDLKDCRQAIPTRKDEKEATL